MDIDYKVKNYTSHIHKKKKIAITIMYVSIHSSNLEFMNRNFGCKK